MPIDVFALFVAIPIVGLTAFGAFFMCRAWAEDAGDTQESSPAETAYELPVGFGPVTWLLAALYIVMGLPKLGSLSMVLHRFQQHWGYSQGFMYAIGVLEFLGAIGLLIPKVRLPAAGGLSVIMAGAIYTHLAFDPAVYTLLPTVSLALLIFVGYESYWIEWEQT